MAETAENFSQEVTESRHSIEEPIETPDAGAGQGGEGEDGQGTPSVDYAGFESIDDLLKDYGIRKKENQELSSLKGRLGNEIGTLRAEKSKLEGMLEGLKTVQTQTQQGPSLSELEHQYDEGEITLPQFLNSRDEIITKQTRAAFTGEFDSFKTDLERKASIDRFIAENPGYVEAYNQGNLMEDINSGLPGEWAWDRHQLKTTKEEVTNLKKQIGDIMEKAKKQGFELGVKAEKGKATSSQKVLAEKGGSSFAQAKNPDLTDPNKRVDAAYSLLKKLRE